MSYDIILGDTIEALNGTFVSSLQKNLLILCALISKICNKYI